MFLMHSHTWFFAELCDKSRNQILVTKPSFTLQVYQQFVPEYQFLPPLILSRKWLVAGSARMSACFGFWIKRSDRDISVRYESYMIFNTRSNKKILSYRKDVDLSLKNFYWLWKKSIQKSFDRIEKKYPKLKKWIVSNNIDPNIFLLNKIKFGRSTDSLIQWFLSNADPWLEVDTLFFYF